MLGEPRDFIARIQLLEEQGAARIVSKPHVITLSDVEAVLAATTEFFVRVAGEEEVDLFNVPVGTTLRVTPHVFTDNQFNKIKLLVNIEDGTQSSATQVDNIPVIERANISTQAVVNEGDSLLVGGLVRETYRNTRYQVPVLGRVPLIGGLFRSKQNQATRVERLFLITPRLAAGFNGGSQATLAGSSQQIVNDAAGRIRSSDFADRPSMNYKPRTSTARSDASVQLQPTDPLLAPGTRALPTPSTKPMPAPVTRPVVVQEIAASELNTPVSQAQLQPNQTAQPTINSNEFAVIKDDVFITPFSVKPW
jgi:type III secretion protein C